VRERSWGEAIPHDDTPDVKTKVVHFKSSPLEDTEAEELLDQMDKLALHDHAYASLHAHCKLRFPHLIESLPKPEPPREMPTAATSFNYQMYPQPLPILTTAHSYQVSPPLQPLVASAYGYQAPLPPQPPIGQPWTSAPALPPPPFSKSKPPGFFRSRNEGCAFCTQKGHHLRECPVAEEYVDTGRAIVHDNRIHLPNGQPVPNNGTGRRIKASIDNWLTAQYSSQTMAPTARIEEVVETHILQVAEFSSPPPANESEDKAMDIFEVFAAQKKKREDKVTKLPELSGPATQTTPAPLPTTQPKPPSASNKPGPQYCYQATAEDQRLVSELQAWLLDGKLTQTMLAHVLAASPTICKELVERLQVRHVEVNTLKGYSKTYPPTPSILHKPEYSLPLLEIDITLSGSISEPAVLDPGLQIIIIWKDLAQEVNVHVNSSQRLEMEGANGITNWTLGCAEYLSIQVGNVPLKVHVHIVEKALFRLLLGRPFQRATLCCLEDLPSGEVEVSIRDPADLA
jgi:hypothetical protein